MNPVKKAMSAPLSACATGPTMIEVFMNGTMTPKPTQNETIAGQPLPSLVNPSAPRRNDGVYLARL
jgi:hypothetical protein